MHSSEHCALATQPRAPAADRVSIYPPWVSNLMFWAPEHSPNCWYHQNRGGNELWHYRLCIQSPLLYRSTTGPIPQPPLPAAQSRNSRIETPKTAQIHVESSPAAPPTWPTTWIQATAPLKVLLAHAARPSAAQRAASTACHGERGR